MRYRSTIVAVFLMLMIVGRAGAGEGFEIMGLGSQTCATFAKAYQNAAIPERNGKSLFRLGAGLSERI
jgi:hypothetical protein